MGLIFNRDYPSISTNGKMYLGRGLKNIKSRQKPKSRDGSRTTCKQLTRASRSILKSLGYKLK